MKAIEAARILLGVANAIESPGSLVGLLMRKLWRWPNRNQSGNSCRSGFRSWN